MAEAQEDKRAESTSALPQVFGRYLLLRRISRGGMGEIFLAKLGEIQGFEKLVIIKKVLPHLAADAEFIKRFIDEAQVAIKLNHANIAPVFEVGRVDGEYFLAIAYIEGRDLRRTMARLREQGGPVPPELALYVAREVAAGLAYAHRRTDDDGKPLNLVHCDVSPPNVMLSFEGEVKIIDFGIAKSAIRLAQSNPNMGFGKFGYMAPEQLLRGGVIDKRADLYAAGVVLYELLVGDRMVVNPEGGDYRAVARAVTQGKFPPPSARNPNIPPQLDALVMKAIAVKADERFQSGESLRDAIQTELARLNPTISGDQLALVLRELFADELQEERELLARMNEVDLAPFRDELTAATVSHTVTFARAPDDAPAPSVPALSEGAVVVEEVPIADIEGDRDTGERVPRRAGAGVLWLALVAMIFGAGIVVLLFKQTRPPIVATPTPVAPVPVTTPPPVATPPTATPPVGPTPVPVVTPLAAPTPPVDHHKHGHHDKTGHVAPHAGVTAEAVQGKFKKVRGEYGSFKGQYGGVLEERWNAIANEITYGRAGNDQAKYEKIDQMLDSLRHEMQKVRDGG